MTPIRRALKQLVHNPWIDVSVGTVLVLSGFWEAWETFPQDFANSNYGVHHGVIVLGIVTVIRAIADMFAGLDFMDEAEYRETTKRSVH